MTPRFVIASQSIIWIIVALLLLLAPGLILTFFGFETSPYIITLARIFGSELAGLALVSWLTKDMAETKILRGLIYSYFTCNTLGFIASLLGRLSGAMLPSGWLVVVLYLLYALLFAYLLLTTLRRART